ncbi:hypothetical protein [Mesoterricola silvestris]|uniref:Uncharacterized protein n=1 Tax=Mesoterricola silvestris TaxID=2927979 RepID=A0AA48GTK8_9BACT|nr:hypothetical protein [Mesoterricola silvestris]BDU73802.1 hypothetical protein METEAL_29760 [Mesoterricola silvestris]
MSRLLLPLLLGTALCAAPAEIRQYATRVDIQGDGSGRATATVTLAGDPSDTVEIPVGFKARGFALTEGPKGLKLEPYGSAIRVVLPPERGAWTFTFTFTALDTFIPEAVPEGEKARIPATSRVVRHAFVQTFEDPIAAYSVEAVLPPGYRFQAIKEALPKVRKTESEPRVRLGRTDGRQTAILRVTRLKQGDSAAMTLEATPSSRSILWLVTGLAIAGLYLFLFRDMVQSRH